MSVELTEDLNGIKYVLLRNPRSGLFISWRNDRGEELLFTSSKATFNKSPTGIRGGISICFPQFGNCGSLEQHGFMRNKIWTIEENPPPLHPEDSLGKSFVDLLFRPTEEDMKSWPNCEVRIEGLETLDYLDNLCRRERFTEQGDAITFESEIDRVYLSSPACIAVLDHERKRTHVLRKEGLPDVVVCNPWEKKCKTMADFGDDDYKHMLCVDGAAIEKNITLKAGEEWTRPIELVAVPSSFCTLRLDPRLNFFC